MSKRKKTFMVNLSSYKSSFVDLGLAEHSNYPSMYEVILVCSDITVMEYPLSILQGVFNKNATSAENIIRKADSEYGIICGLYTKDVAETKMIKVVEGLGGSVSHIKCIMRKSDKNVI